MNHKNVKPGRPTVLGVDAEMAAQMKWENSCRLCSEEKVEMLQIFGEEGLRRRVPQKLRVCLPVMVYKTDPLPKQICQFCAARLDDAFEFREYCLGVYKNMHLKLLTSSSSNSVKIFLDAMFNSSDPCQVQLCMMKQRAPPPLVPLPSLLPDNLEPSSITIPKMETTNVNIVPLARLPCDVRIKEEPFDVTTKQNLSLYQDDGSQSFVHENSREINESDKDFSDSESMNDGKQTSILEQVLTGSLSINDSPELVPNMKLNPELWCSPCNNHYQTKESFIEHMEFKCPQKNTCGKCSIVFKTVEELAKHETENHSQMDRILDKLKKECFQRDREFISWEMLEQHQLHDHLAESIEFAASSWCSLCSRFLPKGELYCNHHQLHENGRSSNITDKSMMSSERNDAEVLKQMKRARGIENITSLTCTTCGKVCTQQSALSNHMRTHKPKKYKCDICDRSFELFIRLAAHKLNEHNIQPSISPVMTSVEQEEALNAEREAREAHEGRLKKSNRCRTFSEVIDDNDLAGDEERASKRSTSVNIDAPRNVARCGICQKSFDDHTTMLIHLQTHSDNSSLKPYTCSTCNKSFKEKWQLQRHEVSHKRSEACVYECSICSKPFPDRVQLDAHKKIHIVDRTYHCLRCNKIFFKELSLATHPCPSQSPSTKLVTVHTNKNHLRPVQVFDKKRFKCPKCPDTFDTIKLRNLHIRIHAEAQFSSPDVDLDESHNDSMPKLKPQVSSDTSIPITNPNAEITGNQCPVVPQKRTLIRTTNGYRCGVCQSPFVLRDLAVAHLRSAHPVMPYQCPYCKKRFITQFDFSHHIKAQHPNESEK